MRKFFVLFGAAVLILGACGDNSGGGNTTTTGTGSTTTTGTTGPPPVELQGSVNNHGTGDATSGAIEVEQDNDGSDFYFGPTFLKGTPGEKVTVHLSNKGSIDHTFTIDSMGIDETLSAGDTKDIDVTLPDSGATLFYCRFHQSSGMQGAFFFNEGDTVNP